MARFLVERFSRSITEDYFVVEATNLEAAIEYVAREPLAPHSTRTYDENRPDSYYGSHALKDGDASWISSTRPYVAKKAD